MSRSFLVTSYGQPLPHLILDFVSIEFLILSLQLGRKVAIRWAHNPETPVRFRPAQPTLLAPAPIILYRSPSHARPLVRSTSSSVPPRDPPLPASLGVGSGRSHP